MPVMKIGGRLLSNLLGKPATRDYPAVPRRYPDASRGHLEFDPGDCILCGICSRKCPASAISVDKKSRTVTVDRMMCVQCAYCVESCPKSCLSIVPGYTEPGSSRKADVFPVPEKDGGTQADCRRRSDGIPFRAGIGRPSPEGFNGFGTGRPDGRRPRMPRLSAGPCGSPWG